MGAIICFAVVTVAMTSIMPLLSPHNFVTALATSGQLASFDVFGPISHLNLSGGSLAVDCTTKPDLIGIAKL